MVRRALALIGDARIALSPSPAIHDAIFGAGTYTLLPGDDATAAFDLAERSLRGVNVTAPHKAIAASRYRAVLDEEASRVGAVNTVVFGDDGRATVASNTDVVGLLEAWRRASITLEGRRVAIVGAGGAARAAVVAAKDAGAAFLVVHARRRDQAVALVNHAAAVGLDAEVATLDVPPAYLVVFAISDLDDVDGWLRRSLGPTGVVHDLRYGARTFAVRNAALRGGFLFLDGTSMLLAQALASATLFGGPVNETARVAAGRALAAALRRPGQ
jgi:shikimate dehydrogenase